MNIFIFSNAHTNSHPLGWSAEAMLMLMFFKNCVKKQHKEHKYGLINNAFVFILINCYFDSIGGSPLHLSLVVQKLSHPHFADSNSALSRTTLSSRHVFSLVCKLSQSFPTSFSPCDDFFKFLLYLKTKI
jgi:hypothetical protein